MWRFELQEMAGATIDNSSKLKFGLLDSAWSAPSLHSGAAMNQQDQIHSQKKKKKQMGDENLLLEQNPQKSAKDARMFEQGGCTLEAPPNSGGSVLKDSRVKDQRKCKVWVMEAKLPWDKSADIMSNGHKNWALNLADWQKLVTAKQLQRICNRKSIYPFSIDGTQDCYGQKKRDSQPPNKGPMRKRIEGIVSTSACTLIDSRCKRQQMQGFLEMYSGNGDEHEEKETATVRNQSPHVQVG